MSFVRFSSVCDLIPHFLSTDVPIVKIRIDPESPVIENESVNVTLYCDVEAGNPKTLLKVQWFLDGAMLKELPICNGECKLISNDSRTIQINFFWKIILRLHQKKFEIGKSIPPLSC